MAEIEQLQSVLESLKKRSRKARRTAWFAVFLIVTTVFLMIFFFYAADFFRVEISIPFSVSDTGGSERESDPELRKLQLQKELKKVELEKASLESSRLTKTIADSAAKVGAVLICVIHIDRFNFFNCNSI